MLLGELGVLLAEAIDTASGVDEALLTGEERMAGGADFDVHDFALGGKDFHDVAACADKLSLVDFRMDAFFHLELLVDSADPRVRPYPPWQADSRLVARFTAILKKQLMDYNFFYAGSPAISTFIS